MKNKLCDDALNEEDSSDSTKLDKNLEAQLGLGSALSTTRTRKCFKHNARITTKKNDRLLFFPIYYSILRGR